MAYAPRLAIDSHSYCLAFIRLACHLDCLVLALWTRLRSLAKLLLLAVRLGLGAHRSSDSDFLRPARLDHLSDVP